MKPHPIDFFHSAGITGHDDLFPPLGPQTHDPLIHEWHFLSLRICHSINIFCCPYTIPTFCRLHRKPCKSRSLKKSVLKHGMNCGKIACVSVSRKNTEGHPGCRAVLLFMEEHSFMNHPFLVCSVRGISPRTAPAQRQPSASECGKWKESRKQASPAQPFSPVFS